MKENPSISPSMLCSRNLTLSTLHSVQRRKLKRDQISNSSGVVFLPLKMPSWVIWHPSATIGAQKNWNNIPAGQRAETFWDGKQWGVPFYQIGTFWATTRICLLRRVWIQKSTSNLGRLVESLRISSAPLVLPPSALASKTVGWVAGWLATSGSKTSTASTI